MINIGTKCFLDRSRDASISQGRCAASKRTGGDADAILDAEMTKFGAQKEFFSEFAQTWQNQVNQGKEELAKRI
jgi:hypothetical protein